MRPTAAVVGGGPSGLMAAEVLASAGVAVTVYDRMPSVGRKLLLAGRSGLNLTHSEPLDDLLDRYGPARSLVERAVRDFGPDEVRAWCEGLGEDTFVGTSGRVFPTAFRATPLLRAWLGRLDGLGVVLRPRHTWSGWDDAGRLVFVDAAGTTVTVDPDVTVLALGGASWPRVGSDGRWTSTLAAAGVEVAPLRPANCGVRVAWTDPFRERFAGQPVKNLRISVGGSSERGEAVVTRRGLEGGAVYGVVAAVRQAIDRDGSARLGLDLHPDLDVGRLVERLGRRRAGDSTSTLLRRVGLAPVSVGLLRESTGNRLPSSSEALAELIKDAPLAVEGIEPIERAISTAGGVAAGEVDDAFMLRRRPGTFVVGEMLDWEAPTGGYLLQACLSTGVAAARGALRLLEGRATPTG